MKILSVKNLGDELFLIKYKSLFRTVQRYAIQTESIDEYSPFPFMFRDNNSTIHSADGNDILKWMIRNDIQYFTNDLNTKSPVLIKNN